MPRVRAENAKQALWLRHNLNFKLHDGQLVIEKNYEKIPKQLFVVNCARRFGKSYWLAKKAIECALNCKNKNPRIRIATDTLKALEEFILPAFAEILHDCPEEIWPGWEHGYVRSKKKFVGFCPNGDQPNGAEIQLVGLDKDPDGLRGNYADMIGIDEAGKVDGLKYLYSSVMGPMVLTRPGSKILMLSTPATTPAHDFVYFQDRAKLQKSYVELNIFQNPMMTPELIEKAHDECLTESDWRREYLCENVIDEQRAIVPEFTKAIVKEIERPNDFRFYDRYEGMDLGTKIDLTAVLFGYWDPVHRYVYIEDEFDITGPKMTTPELAKLIRDVEKERWEGLGPPYRRIADNNNPLLLQDLGFLHDIHFAPTSKDDLHAMVNDLRRLIKNSQVFIHPRCKKLIGCLESAIWDKHRKQFDRSAHYGHFDHLAALMYLVRNLDIDRNEVPKLKAATQSTFRRESKERHRLTETVKQMLGINRKP